MDVLQARLQDLAPSIKRILDISGVAGTSIGVVHQNQVVHLSNFGYRNLTSKEAPDENTIYHIASLSKSFTSASVGILAREGKLSFDDPVSKVLPAFTHFDPLVRDHATVLDFLSHRTGLATKPSLWEQDYHELLLSKADSTVIVSYLDVVKPLRTLFNYNNWGYDIAANVIEHISGRTWGEFVTERILRPLDLNRTYVDLDIADPNYADGYMPASGSDLSSVGRPRIGSGTIQQGANGIKTTVSDLLKYYQAMLRSWKSGAFDSPLQGIAALFADNIDMDPRSQYKQCYGAGWALVELPAPIGAIGTNPMLVPKMPLLGKGTSKKPLWYHNGSLVGFFSSVHVLPDTDTIIVVLVNSIPKNDAADWIGQMLVEAVLDNEVKNDYVLLAEESAKAYEDGWKQLSKKFDNGRGNDVNNEPLAAFAGKFYNKPGNWFIEVFLRNNQLFFSFQGLASQQHQLRPHGKRSFSWLPTERQSRKMQRWPDLEASTYVFCFEGTDNDISSLRWVNDADVPEGELFTKAIATSEQLKQNGGRKEYALIKHATV